MKSIIDPYQTIGIIGLAKNTGKTTTLNAILSFYPSTPIAITSIGLDGEDLDQVNFLPKPKIHITKNMVVATAEACLKENKTPYEVLEHTDLPTALGEILIVKFLQETHVVVAGPTTNKGLNRLLKLLKKYAKKIFVDGAFNRKTFANISEIDAIILATGANVSETMDETIQITKSIENYFLFPVVDKFNPIAKIMLQTEDKDLYLPDKNPEKLSLILEPKSVKLKALYIEGAITDKLLNTLLKTYQKNYHLIIDDATKLLAHPKSLDYLNTFNVKISVRHKIPLIAITLNPTRPIGEHYDALLFYKAMKAVIKTPIFDVMRME